MNFPDNLKYTPEHEWILVEGNVGTIGITDFAQSELGDIVYLDIPSKGKTIAQNDVFGTVEAVKAVSDLFIPITGKVIEVHTAINDTPENVNKDPYQSGWLIKVEIVNPSELDSLLSAEAYKKLINK